MPKEKTSKATIQWQVEQVRFTAFVAVMNGDADTWWNVVVGEPAESKTVKARGASQQFEGRFQNAKLVLNYELNRVDWIAAAQVDVQKSVSDVPSIGPLEEVFALFDGSMMKWLALGVPVIRLAWAAVLVAPVEDRIAGYRQLAGFLPAVQIDPTGSSDFLYQINRPRESKSVEELMLNRLHKWSVLQYRSFGLHLPSPQGEKVTGILGPGLSACRAEIEVNSSSERTDIIPADKVTVLYQELVELGREIAVNGDIA